MVTAAEDATGRRYEYTYDSHGRLASASTAGVELDVTGATTTVTEGYTPVLTSVASVADLNRGAQLAEVLRADDSVALHLDWDGDRVTTVRRGSGAGAITVSIVADSATDPVEWTVTEGVTAASPTVTRIRFEDQVDGWLQTVVADPDGALPLTSTTTLDRDGRVVESIDPGGITTVTDYLAGRRRVSFSPRQVTTTPGSVGEARPETPSELVTTYRYVAGTTLLEETERPGPSGPLVTVIGRDPRGNPQTVTAPDGTVTTRSFDALGRVQSVTSATGAVTVMEYEDVVHGSGEVERTVTTSAAGVATTLLTRSPQGHVTASRSADGISPERQTSTQVNVLGWSLESRSSASTSRTSYDSDGRIHSIVSGSGSGDGFSGLVTTTPGYTSAGMIETITRSQGGLSELSSMTYDDAGRLSTSTSSGLTRTYAYDGAGRTRTRTEDAAGPSPLTTVYAFDDAGRLETTTTPGSRIWTSVYDTLGRSVGRVDPAGVREDLTLTTSGQVATRKLVYNTNGATWAWQEHDYDLAGRPRSVTVYRFPVTPAPDLTDPEALTTTTTYYDVPGDSRLGLVHTVTDPLGRETRFDYDDAGRETTRHLADGTTVTTTYTPDGKVHTRTVAHPGPEGAWQLTTATTYDDQGRVHTVTQPGNRVTTSSYDELGRRQSELAADSAPGDPDEQPVERFTSWSYGDLGRTVTTTRPDGATITREYDDRGNLVAYKDHDDNRTEYGYDVHGRLQTITYPDGSSRSITYLADGEVDTITRADGTVVDLDYDPAGRLDTVTATAERCQALLCRTIRFTAPHSRRDPASQRLPQTPDLMPAGIPLAGSIC